VANAVRRFIAPAFKAFRPRSPSIPDTMVAMAGSAAMIQRATGVPANDTPLVGAAIGFGVIAPAFRAVEALARMMPAAFAAFRRLATGR
jgi:hypothetical protein